MSNANDIKNLFAKFGGKPEGYQEIAIENAAVHSRERWPILKAISPEHAEHPPSVGGRETLEAKRRPYLGLGAMRQAAAPSAELASPTNLPTPTATAEPAARPPLYPPHAATAVTQASAAAPSLPVAKPQHPATAPAQTPSLGQSGLKLSSLFLHPAAPAPAPSADTSPVAQEPSVSLPPVTHPEPMPMVNALGPKLTAPPQVVPTAPIPPQVTPAALSPTPGLRLAEIPAIKPASEIQLLMQRLSRPKLMAAAPPSQPTTASAPAETKPTKQGLAALFDRLSSR